MKFQGSFWRSLVAIFQGRPKAAVKEANLSDVPVQPAENLARYIFSRNHFTTSPRRVKFNAFLPPADLELSIYRTSGLQEPQIWELGNTRVAAPSGRTIKARGDLKAASVGTALSVQRDPLIERHATITGWPVDPSAQQLLAKQLAAAATLRLPQDI